MFICPICQKECKGEQGVRSHKRVHDPEMKARCFKLGSGEQHPSWKGANISKNRLHIRFRGLIQQPEACMKCGKITKTLQLSNISGKYKYDINDWEYLCVPCHIRYDRFDVWGGKLRRKMTAEKQNEFQEKYLSGISYKELMKHFGISLATTSFYAKKLNLINRSIGAGRKKAMT
jgi:hypothetical protein